MRFASRFSYKSKGDSMASIFLAIPAYAEPALPRTIDSAIRQMSLDHTLHIAVAEQVSSYVEAYALSRILPDEVQLDFALVGDQLIGLGGARSLAETRYYNDEDIQVQVDAHARFEADWDRTVVSLLQQLENKSVITQGSWADPWTDAGKVPVIHFDRFDAGLPAGHIKMIDPGTGVLDEIWPARTVLGGAIAGHAWCREVPADPYILFGGEEPAMAARLWTHGWELWQARLPWVQPIAGTIRAPNRPWERTDWAERNATSYRRVKSLLTGQPLDGDEASHMLDLYGLGSARSLSQWVDYSGLDFAAETVRSPWP